MAARFLDDFLCPVACVRYADSHIGRGFVRQEPDLASGGLRPIYDRGGDLFRLEHTAPHVIAPSQ